MWGIFAIFMLALLFGPTQARNLNGRYDDSPNHAWFEAQRNSEGASCCAQADGHFYDGPYTINKDGSITVTWNYRNFVIPKKDILTTPNPTGRAVWWWTPDSNDRPHTWCFSPGPLT